MSINNIDKLTLSGSHDKPRDKWIIKNNKQVIKIKSTFNDKYLSINKDRDRLEVTLDDENQSVTQEWSFEELEKDNYIIKSSFNESICLAIEKRNNINKIILATYRNSQDNRIRQKTWFLETLDGLPKIQGS